MYDALSMAARRKKEPGDPDAAEGARPSSPAGAGEPQPPRKDDDIPLKPRARKKPSIKVQKVEKTAPQPNPESKPESKGSEPTSSPTPSVPEVVWEDKDKDEDDEDEDEDSSKGRVLDVGSTMPSLPAMPGINSQTSVPAVRAREGGLRTSALDYFLTQMGKYPLLTLAEEQELTMAYWERKDPVAARKLVVHNLRLVVKMAYKYRRAWANVLDLIQEGNMGLVEAVGRFDPFKGAKFSTYATFWIRAYMLRYLLEHSRMVRISRTRVGRKLFFRLSKEREKLRAQGLEPGPQLLAEKLGVGQRELEEVVRHMDQSEVRLDAPMYSDDASGGTMLDALEGEGASPEALAYRREFDTEVSAALDSFAATLTDPREKVAWRDHLMSDDPASLSELGARFGVTKQRMGQIVTALRKRLKEHLMNTLGPDVQLGFSLDSE